LARSRSTTELLPLGNGIINYAAGRTRPLFELLRLDLPAAFAARAPDATRSMSGVPLRIFFRGYDLAIAHVDDAVAVGRGLGIVRDHQHGLP
jgi:hypothetical protein